MNARQHLIRICDAQKTGDIQCTTVGANAIHDAANFLSVPELEPKAFQQALCLLLKSRADAQHLPAKGVKRERAYIEGLMGAGMALQVLGSDQLNPFLILASLGTIRGAVDAVDAVAQGKPLP